MKKAVSLFLALIVLLSAGYSAAEDMEGYSGVYEVPYAGFHFTVPETYRNLAGSLEFNIAEMFIALYLRTLINSTVTGITITDFIIFT